MSQTEGSICHKRQIVTVHDLIPLLFPKYHKRQYCYFRFAYRSILKNAVKVITVSQNTKDLLIDRYSIEDEKIAVIHNGISAEYSNCETDSHKQGYVLYVGRFAPTKNIEGLVRAFEILMTEYKIDLELKLVGVRVTSNLNVGKEARRRITCIENISAEDRLIDLYKRAALLVLPSFHEGFGITPVEAMACGCPTVVSNLASLPEVCGDAAYYIDPYDAESIAEGMYKVATDEQLRDTLISKGLSRARMFSWDKSARQHISVFEEVMNL
ncbi:MAG: glycosyltransferase family 4 protein [Phycisphaerales bacterium]|nr:MAG: glycosyltransferase family 4 protein [Phycisphaerales bacterium]